MQGQIVKKVSIEDKEKRTVNSHPERRLSKDNHINYFLYTSHSALCIEYTL